MTRIIRKMIGILLAVAITATVGTAAENHGSKKTASDGAEPSYMGEPLSYWLRFIQDRDKNNMDLALDAIRELGPDARSAVPELTQIVAEPSAPIEIGVDKRSVIAFKIRSILLRSDAIDALAAIGEAATPSTVPLIQWELTVRVVHRSIRNTVDDELFVDLVYRPEAQFRVSVLRSSGISTGALLSPECLHS